MVRQTLLVVAGMGDGYLLHLAGTMLRYAWHGVRTVLVLLDEGEIHEKRMMVSRITALLGVEQGFHWQTEPTLSNRLARALRAFQPQVILTTPTTVDVTREAWQMATDERVKMAGVALLNGHQSTLWSSGGSSAIIEVPLTDGIRHALTCLLWDDPLSVAEMRRMVAQQEWSAVETFTWGGGASVMEPFPISDFFGITPPLSNLNRRSKGDC
jgi:hypothetical protein